MDDLPVKRPAPFHPKISLSCKTLDFYLKLMLLLKVAKLNQSLMRHCPAATEVCRFPNFTSEAGSPFSFKLPILTTPGHTRHSQLALADGTSSLPHWMTFRRQTSSLLGLALTEDCGIYHLKVSVTGEQHAEYFHLHIRNRTVTDKARGASSCSEGQRTVWASLLLKLNPVTLDARQRFRLVSTMADYLRLQLDSVYLFSMRKSFLQQEERLKVCRQGGLGSTHDKQQSSVELLWHVGCQGEERKSNLVEVLEHSVTTGGLTKLLEAPVLGWTLLCASGLIRDKVKRDLQGPKFTPTPNLIVPPPSQIHQGVSKTRPEQTQADGSPENNTTSVRIILLPQPSRIFTHEKVSTCTSKGKSLKTCHLHKIKVSSSFHFSVKRPALHPCSMGLNTLEQQLFTDRMALTTYHTSTSFEFGCSHPNLFSDHNCQEYVKDTGVSKVRPHVKTAGGSEQAFQITSDSSLGISGYVWTTEEPHLLFLLEHVSTVSTDTTLALLPSSILHRIYPSLTLDSSGVTSKLTHEVSDKISLTTRLTLRPHLKETPLWTGAYRASHTDSESQPTVSSLGPIKDHHAAKPALYNLPSVSHPPLAENSYDVLLLNSGLKTTQSPPPSNKTPSAQLFPDVSPTSSLMTEQLSITQHSDTSQHLSAVVNQDVMSPLSVTTQDVSPTTWTGQLAPSGQTELESSLTTSSMEPPMTTFTPALPSELGFYSTQLETPSVANPEVTEESLKIQKSAYDSVQLTPSMQQSLRTVSHILVTRMTTHVHSHTAFLTTFTPSETYAAPLSIIESTGLLPEDHFEPTTPSAVQDSHTTSFINQIQKLDSSIPLCDQSVAQDHVYVNNCALKIKSTYLESTARHAPNLSTSYSRDEECSTAFRSQFLMFDSSREYFSTQKWSPAMHLSASATTGINHITAAPQMDISDAFPPQEHSGFSVVTYTSLAASTSALTIENSLLIRQTDSSGPVTKGHPTQQILSTSLSPLYGTSTTLLTSLQAVGLSSYRRQSSVQPSSSSASISSSVNLPPQVSQSVPVLMATVGFPFRYSVPPKTFIDPEDGEADTLSLEITLIDGPPISIGTWLTLDGLELHGVPLEVDLQFAPQHLLLAARDRQGLSTWLPLTLDIRRSPVDPCHVFTLTAQRSLHSVLRHRHRVELMLRKLSRFFNSSSSQHLVVVSMRPGSTVVSWYNHSLCGVGRSRVRRCHVDRIRSMWLAMTSEDGSVNPAFRDSMLPEFPITKVGPVSYRQDCFSVPSTTVLPSLGANSSLSPTTNTCVSASPAIAATSQQRNHYQWMAGMFTALLVVCLLILIVLLVAVVLHFCRGRGRTRTVAIWPASSVLSLQTRDLRAIKPRRPPILQPELPPPPLRLWIHLSQDDEGPPRFGEGRKTLDRALHPRPPQYDFSSI